MKVDNTEFIDYVPHYEVSKHQLGAQVLLLPVNRVPSAKGIVTGKVFEYLQTNRPILAIAPTNGDLANIIRDTKTGAVVGFDDIKKLKQSIHTMYLEYRNNSLEVVPQNIEQYHRKQITKELCLCLSPKRETCTQAVVLALALLPKKNGTRQI